MRPTIPRLICLALTALVLPAHAVDRPAKAKTITVIVPFTHGGPTDEIAQSLAQGLAASLKQKVVARSPFQQRCQLGDVALQTLAQGLRGGGTGLRAAT